MTDKNGLPLDLDIGGDLAELKKNLAKLKKGKHGKRLDDIDIEELDFVSSFRVKKQLKYFLISDGKQQEGEGCDHSYLRNIFVNIELVKAW